MPVPCPAWRRSSGTGRAAAVFLIGVLAGCAAEDSPRPDAGRDAVVDAAGVDVSPEAMPEATPETPSGACPLTPARSRWAEWNMPDPRPGGPGMASYDTSATGVVLDRVTHLMWQRQVPVDTHDWEQATAYCACLRLAGHDDWRLPTRIELVSLVDYTRSFPAIDPQAFPDTPSEWFWTSSIRADDPGSAWFVYFENGYSHHHQKDEPTYRVRCVRDADAPATPVERYVPRDDGVLDQRTGLTWQRQVDGQLRTWEAARSQCQAMAAAGRAWRLPSMKELQTLVDDSRAEPSIDPMFPDTPLEPFWTASAVVATPGSAWRVSFIHGYTYDASATYEYHTRCVR
jgi:hypothetical protein